MGDMKTPDFDDLLAAFDIPDIDAKDAIQSNPEEQRDEAATAAPENKSGTPPCFADPAAPQSEPPVVSVIVKNTVRSESLEEEDRTVGDKTDSPSSSALAPQVSVKLDELASQFSPKESAGAAVEPQISNGFEEDTPNNQNRSSTQSWPRTSPFQSTLDDNDGEGDKRAESGSVQHTTDVISGLRPLLYPQSSDPTVFPSPAASSPAVNPHPHSHQTDEACIRSDPIAPLPQNGSLKTEIKSVIYTDEDDSDPDFGSPLVIQESPESLTSSSPKFKHRAKLYPEHVESLENTSHLVPQPPNLSFTPTPAQTKPQHEEDGQPTSISSSMSTPQSHDPQASLPSESASSAMVQEEKYPDHVIDDRDSPESPPPSETGLLFTNRSSTPDSVSTGSALNHSEMHRQEQLRRGVHSQEDNPGEAEELSENVVGDGEKPSKENCSADSEETLTSSVTGRISSPLPSLKVKIKMPNRNVPKTMTSGMSKRGGKASVKDVDHLRPSPEHQNTTSKKELLHESELSAVATLEGESKPKPKASPTAVTVTKTTALPSVSSARVSPGTISLRSLGQKTLNSGVTLSAPLPLLPPQSSSRPASIVNSSGAFISKSQTNLVEAFNKILNNKNLLPSYKPELSSPLPAEWGITLPAQVSCNHMYQLINQRYYFVTVLILFKIICSFPFQVKKIV